MSTAIMLSFAIALSTVACVATLTSGEYRLAVISSFAMVTSVTFALIKMRQLVGDNAYLPTLFASRVEA